MTFMPTNSAMSCIRFPAGSDLDHSAPALCGGGFWLSALSPSGLGAFCFPALVERVRLLGIGLVVVWSLVPWGTSRQRGYSGSQPEDAIFCQKMRFFARRPGRTRAKTRIFRKTSGFFPDFPFFWLILSERG